MQPRSGDPGREPRAALGRRALEWGTSGWPAQRDFHRRARRGILLSVLHAAALWSLPLVACAAVAVDNTSNTQTASSGNSLSWNHTVGSGSNTVLVVEVLVGGGEHAQSVTYNGVAMTAVGTKSVSSLSLGVWILAAPASGTHAIQVSLSDDSIPVVGGAISFTGVNQTTPESGWTTASGTSITSSLTKSSGSGLFVDAIGAKSTSASTSSQTLEWSTATTSAGYAAGGSTTSNATGATSWQFPASSAWVAGGLWLSAASTDAVGPNHYEVAPVGSAVNCALEPIEILPHDSAHNPVVTTNTIQLTTSTGHGDWILGSGAGVFTGGAANSGAATYQFSGSDGGIVLFFLKDTYPETVTIGVSDGSASAVSGTATAAEDPAITFAPTGFRVTNGSNAPAIIATQVAGVTSTQSLALQAVRTDTATGACTSVFASGTTVNVGLGYQCNNPTSCIAGQALSITNNGVTTSLASNPNSGVSSYTSVPLTFSTSNAEAPFTLNYTDVGQITLAALYTIPLKSGAASANSMIGSGQFVVQPYTLQLSKIKTTAGGVANPAAASASGAVFTGAGQTFTATVTATNLAGNATPNFGQETSPASVTLTPNLVLPASGHNPPLSGGFGAFAGGAATGTAFAWPEVGIITLTPGVSSYLSSGAVVGTTSGNVGRFIPTAFATSLNTPVFGTACTAGGFTYVGQPFTYIVAPVITATALASGGTTTQNYTGSLMRLSNSSLTGRTYTSTPSSAALTLTGLPASSADPAIMDLGGGQASLTFSAGSGISFARGSATAPFAANVALAINLIDLDGVAAANPVTFGSAGGISFSAGASQYYGRLSLQNSLGTELLDLPMPLTTQYYLGTSQGFATNTADSCTPAPTLSFSNYQQNLSAGATCVRDSGSPGVSGIGCPAAASNRYAGTASAGGFNLILAAPGSGRAGAVTVTATAPAWLQYLWNAGSGTVSNPAGLATFGVYPGSTKRVYQREVY